MITRVSKAAIIICLACGLTAGLGNSAFAAQAVSMNELLQQVKDGRVKDAAENKKRIAEFQRDRARQQKLLADMRNEQTRQEQRSELFGVLQQAAGDARGNFETSLTQIQYPDRTEWLTKFAQKMGQTTRMPTMEEIERIWFELQREMTASGKVLRIPTTVINASGEEEQVEVVRVGLFNAVADGKYLEFIPETGRLIELQRQPQSRYTGRAEDLEEATTGLHSFAIDPTRGQLLSLLVQSPSLMERIAQGKVVGYVIITIGIVGLLIALWRMAALAATSAKVNRQAKNLEQPGNNPLGRVIKVAHDSPDVDVEGLELKLGEAILKETPQFYAWLPFLKIISVVAPLLGLLGTVTGMIVTFQAITLYGAGDPKLMAGGISTALVTTVLGLVVAIPMVFLHTLVQSRSKRLTQILQEEAAGMLSERAERGIA
jgi:biopolymer transport protein ExbB